jgi:hypothetical protein
LTGVTPLNCAMSRCASNLGKRRDRSHLTVWLRLLATAMMSHRALRCADGSWHGTTLERQSLRTTKGWGNGADGETRPNRSWMKQQKSNEHREVPRLAEWEKL